jgi:hypothetical protein
MAIILIAIVLAVITGLNYFAKPISRTMWLVLFILSSRRSGPDTIDLFPFLTLSNFRVSFGIGKEYATRSGPNTKR